MTQEVLENFKNNFLQCASSMAYEFEGTCDKEEKNLMDILKTYKFSISWSQIYPNGKGEVNEKELEFYDNLIDELLKNNIRPIIILYHCDLPKCLQDSYGGWESRDIIKDFNNYCITLFKRFGDRVKYWITLNEQNIFIKLGYDQLDVKNKKRMLQANHVANLANAKVIQSFRKYVPNGMIGPSFAFSPIYSYSCNPEDVLAAENAEDLECRWWMDVYCKGSYPATALKYYENLGVAPIIEDGDLELLEKSIPDFIGINYYESQTVDGNNLDKKENFIYEKVKNPNLRYTNWGRPIDPYGLRIALRRITVRYNLPILVSENGFRRIDKLHDVINDEYKMEYLKMHIKACKDSINDGVELLGYCI